MLVVHHTPSPALQEMFEAAVSGARAEEVEGVQVVIRSALTAAAADVLRADGYLLGTPANIGYMSGALRNRLRHEARRALPRRSVRLGDGGAVVLPAPITGR